MEIGIVVQKQRGEIEVNRRGAGEPSIVAQGGGAPGQQGPASVAVIVGVCLPSAAELGKVDVATDGAAPVAAIIGQQGSRADCRVDHRAATARCRARSLKMFDELSVTVQVQGAARCQIEESTVSRSVDGVETSIQL